MSISLETLICYNNWDKPYLCLYFHIWNHTYNYGQTMCASWRMAESWYDWLQYTSQYPYLESVLPSCTIDSPNLIRCKTNKHNEKILYVIFAKLFVKNNFDTILLWNLPHIKIEVIYIDMIFGVFQLFGMKWIYIHLSNGLVPIRHSVINWNNVLSKTPESIIGL